MKIPIKKYEMDFKATWEERYRKLEKHHEEETKFLIDTVKKLEERIGKASGPTEVKTSSRPIIVIDDNNFRDTIALTYKNVTSKQGNTHIYMRMSALPVEIRDIVRRFLQDNEV